MFQNVYFDWQKVCFPCSCIFDGSEQHLHTVWSICYDDRSGGIKGTGYGPS